MTLVDRVQAMSGLKQGLFFHYDRVERKERRPVFNEIDSAELFDDCIEHYVKRVLALVNETNRLVAVQDQRVVQVRIGKTFAPLRKNTSPSQTKNQGLDPRLSTLVGLKSRWHRHYGPSRAQYQFMAPLLCVTRHDVPATLRALRGDQQLFASILEYALDQELCKERKRLALDFQISGDCGGGGRRGKKTYAGYFVYCAIKLGPRAYLDLDLDWDLDWDFHVHHCVVQ